MTTTISGIAKAFIEAQKAFAPAIKNAKNGYFKGPDGKGSSYANLDSCIKAVIDALHSNNLAFMQKTHDAELGAKVETILIHTSGEIMSGGLMFVPAPKNDPHGFGSALTYARRYSLMAVMGIAPEDDDGNRAVTSMAEKVREAAPVSKKSTP